MTVSAVSPCRTALQRDACLPASVLGPVLLSALRRLASICLYEIMESSSPNWVRFVVLTRPHQIRLAMDVCSAKEREPQGLDQCRSFPTRRLHHRNDAPRDGVRDREGQ